MNHVDLFSGIGGFALAARWAGLETVQFVEIDPFCRKVLQKNFKGVPIHDDIKTFAYSERGGRNGQTISIQPGESRQESDVPTWSDKRPFLLTGGFPCQPFSCAGKRRGKEDDRYLWEEMLRVIKEFKPTWIIGENVNGIRSMEFQDGLSELEGDTAIQEDGDCDYTNVLDGICDSLEAIGYEVQPIIIPACAVNAPHRRDRVWIVAYSVSRSSEISNSGTVDCENGETQKCRKTDIQDSSAYRNCHAADTEKSKCELSGRTRTGREGFTDVCFDAPDSSNQRLQGSERLGSHEQRQAAHGSITERNNTWDEPWIEAATRLCSLDVRLPGGLARPKGWRVNALKAVGNSVVPQIPYLIMKGIIDVEKELTTFNKP